MPEQLYIFIAAFRACDHEWRFPIEELSRGHGVPSTYENRSGYGRRSPKTGSYVKSVPVDPLCPVPYGDDHAVPAYHCIGIEVRLNLCSLRHERECPAAGVWLGRGA